MKNNTDMKLQHKILWAFAGIIPFVLWGIAFISTDYTWSFNLIMISTWYLIVYSIAMLIMQFICGCKKYGIKKTLQMSGIMIVGLCSLYLLLFLILHLCGVLR